jgi:ribosomal protein S18 acetylase RimI-like enzyme
MNYIDYSEVSGYQVVLENENVILLHGYHREAKCYEYHWAANSSGGLLSSINMDTQCLVTFIPHDWIEVFEKSGFVVRNAWHDYFMNSLDAIQDMGPSEFLNEAESEAASEVTMTCAGQSRGFTGQTSAWIREWLYNSELESMESGIWNKVILIARNVSNEIVGIICTGTYSHESEKGAIAWIREIAVKPEYQGRGIARKLITQALAYCKAHGAKRAFLAADECNSYAIHLYESIGFIAGEDSSQIDMIYFPVS